MGKPEPETEDPKIGMMLHRIRCMEAFLELRYGYTVMTGQDLVTAKETKAKSRLEETKQRLEFEKLPVTLLIEKVKRTIFGEPLVNFRNLKDEKKGRFIYYSATISSKVEKLLQEGQLEGFHLLRMSASPPWILAHETELPEIPKTYKVTIEADTPVQVEVAEDAFKK